MLEYKVILGVIAVVVGIVGYLPYFRDIFRGHTKPHVFSWLVWTLLTGIAFVAQVLKGGGAGAWVTGMTMLASVVITITALFRGEKHITAFDWYSFTGALLGIVAWLVTKDPVWAVVIITVVDLLGFLPTFRKTYVRPHEETASTFFLSGLKFVFGILALESYSLATWLYPASLVLTNGLFVFLILVRRRQLHANRDL